MPRNRMIWAEFFADKKLAQVSRDARLTFIGMWIFSDDYGVIKARLGWLKENIYEEDESVTEEQVEIWLNELQEIDAIISFTATDGKDYFHIRNWAWYQKISHPSRRRNPPPPIFDTGGAPEADRQDAGTENDFESQDVTETPAEHRSDSGDTPECLRHKAPKAPKAPKPKAKAQRKAAREKRAHPPALKLWFDTYTAVKGVDYYPSNFGEDTNHAKWMLTASREDLAVLERVYRLYLMDNDKLASKSGWALRHLRQNFNGYFQKAVGAKSPTMNIDRYSKAMLPVPKEEHETK